MLGIFAGCVVLGMTGHPTLVPIVSVFCINNLMTKIFVAGIVGMFFFVFTSNKAVREVYFESSFVI